MGFSHSLSRAGNAPNEASLNASRGNATMRDKYKTERAMRFVLVRRFTRAAAPPVPAPLITLETTPPVEAKPKRARAPAKPKGTIKKPAPKRTATKRAPKAKVSK